MKPAEKLIINAAITGAVLTKRDTPFLPVSVEEIVECACGVREAGASIVHVHARNPDGSPSYDPGLYCLLVDRIREVTDLIVCVTLSGRFVSEVYKRAAALTSRPDMASLTLGSMNFATRESVNSPDVIRELAELIYNAGALPELEIFESGFANYANYLIRKQVLRPPYYFSLLLGSLGSAPFDLVGVGHMVSLLPAGATWAVAGLGRYQLDANVLGIAAGGHVRVGVEDNPYYDRDRKDLADNPSLVARVARIAREMGRETTTPEEARRIIGLPDR